MLDDLDDRPETVRLSDVEILEDGGTELLCCLEDEDKSDLFWVPKNEILEGTDISSVGDVGVLVIPLQIALALGLV